MKNKIENDLRKALKNKEALKVSTLRLVLAALKNETIAKRRELNEDEVITVIQRELKKRKEAEEAYRKGGREELADKEKKEAGVLKEYLPEPLSEIELEKVIEKVIAETNAQSIKDLGKVMGRVMTEVKGKADGKIVSNKVRELLLKLNIVYRNK